MILLRDSTGMEVSWTKPLTSNPQYLRRWFQSGWLLVNDGNFCDLLYQFMCRLNTATASIHSERESESECVWVCVHAQKMNYALPRSLNWCVHSVGWGNNYTQHAPKASPGHWVMPWPQLVTSCQMTNSIHRIFHQHWHHIGKAIQVSW